MPEAPRCEGIEAIAMFYVDGELAEADARDLDAHLRECPACRDHVARLRASLGELRRLAGARAPAGVRTRIRGALDAADARRRRAGWVIPAAAALIALVVALVADAPSSTRTETSWQPPEPSAVMPVMSGPLRFHFAARWFDDRGGRRELVELWRIRDGAQNEIILEVRIVISCFPVPTGGEVLRLRQYH